MDALLREAENIKTSLENASRFLHLMPNEAPKAQAFLDQLNAKIGQLDRSDAKVQAKLPALEAAVTAATAAIDGASKAKEVDAEMKAVEALIKKAQDAARAVIIVPGSAIRPAESDLKKLADALAECEPAFEAFAVKFGNVEKAKAKLPTLKAGLDEAAAKLGLAKDVDQGAAKTKEIIDLLRNTHAKQAHLKGVICGRIVNEKEATDIREKKDALWLLASQVEEHVSSGVTCDVGTPAAVAAMAKQMVKDAEDALQKYEQGNSVDGLRVEVSTWSSKTQDFINRWHDRRAYDAAMEALEKLEALLPALESFGDISSAVTNTVKQARDNVAKVHANIPKAKARFESEPLVDMVKKSSGKLTEFISRPHVQSYFNTAREGLEELAGLLPALEAYSADDNVAYVLKNTKENVAKADALMAAAKLRFESEPLREKITQLHRKLDDFINRPHVKDYYNTAEEAMEELRNALPALENYSSVDDVASTLKTAREKMAKADVELVKARLSFAAEPLKDKLIATYRKLDDFIGRPHVKDYFNTAVEALEELQALVPQVELYSSDSYVASALKNAKEQIQKTEALLPAARLRFESESLNDKVTTTHRKLDDFISRFHVQEYYNTAVEALEELQALLPALEAYSADKYVAENLQRAKAKIASAEALMPEAKARFESSPIIEKIRSQLLPIDTFTRTWHHKPYYDAAVEAIETVNSLLPVLETYSSDRYASDMIQNARKTITAAEAVFPQARARFEGGPLRDKVTDISRKLDNFIKSWHVKEYYDTAIEAIDELNSLLPALEAYTLDDYISSVIANTKKAIAAAEANIPQAKIRFEAGPLREKVDATQSKLDKFIREWYYQEYYNEAMEGIEQLNQMLPALEQYSSDKYVAETIQRAKNKIAQAEANVPQAKIRFEAGPLREKVSSTQSKLDRFIKEWYYQEYYNEAMEAIEQLNQMLPILEQYSSDTYVAETVANAKNKIARAEANIPQAKQRFESAALTEKTRTIYRKLGRFIHSWHAKEYYDEAIEAIEELNMVLPALEQYASDDTVAGVIKTAREEIAKAEANIPLAKARFEGEPLREKVVQSHRKLDRFIKEWYYQDYYNEAMEAINELQAVLPALEAYASDKYTSEVIQTAKNKIAQAEANVPQAKLRFESAALKDKVTQTYRKLDKFIKDWYYKEYYNEAIEALEELYQLLPALEQYVADSYVADTLKTAKEQIAKAEANIPQAKVKFEAEPLKEQVTKTYQKLNRFIKDWHVKEYYDETLEALEELSSLVPALETYSSDTHVAEVIKSAKARIAEAEATLPQAKLRFEAEPLKDQVTKTHQKLDRFIKDWYYKEYYNEAMEAIEQLSLLLPALELYTSDKYVAETIQTAKNKIAQAEANIPQAKVKFDAEPLKNQVAQASPKLDKFIKDWHVKEYYNEAIEVIEELNLLLPALEVYSSDSHVADTIKAAKERIAKAEANFPQAKAKFEAEPLRDAVGTLHSKLDNFIKSWHYQEYYNTAVETISQLEEMLPALETYASDDYVARTIKTARDKIAAAQANFPQARARFEAEPLRAKVVQVYGKLDNFIKTWQHEEYYNTAIEALDELQMLVPALEEFSSDSGAATAIKAAKERIQKAEANLPLARLKFAAEPLRAALATAAGKLDNFIKTWHHEEYYNTAIEALDEVSSLLPSLEAFASDSYVASTIQSAKERVQKAEANLPLAKARFEAKPLQEMVGKSADKLSDFIKTWQHEEYYNKAMEGLNELEALLPVLENYASDSGVATTLKVAKDRIAAVQSLIPQAKRKYEAEPLRQKLTQTSTKLDNFIKSWHHEEYFNTAVEAIAELNAIITALEAYSADTQVSDNIRAAKDKIAKAEANLPLAKAKFEAAPLRNQVQQHFDKLNRFAQQWWIEDYYNAAVESLQELSTLVPRLAAFSDSQAEATVRLAKEKIQAAQIAMKSASLKFQAEPLRKKAEGLVSQLRTSSSKWTTRENVEQGLELQAELLNLVKALQPYAEDSATATVLSSAQQALKDAEDRLLPLRVKFYLQPTLEDVRKTIAALSSFISKWLQFDEYQKGVDAIAKSQRLIEKLAQFGANTEAQGAIAQLKQKVAEAEAQVKVAQAKHGAIKASTDAEETSAASTTPSTKLAPYKPPSEPEWLVPKPNSFLSIAAVLDPPAGLNVGPMKTFVTPLEEQLARALGTSVPIVFNWENFVSHPSFASKPDADKTSYVKTLYQNYARQVVGALAQLVGADQVARNIVQGNLKRLVMQYDPTDMVMEGRSRHGFKGERNGDGDLIVTINLTGNHQLEAPLRNQFDALFNVTTCQAQSKALLRTKELTDKARVGAYLDIEFAPFGLHKKFLDMDPSPRAKHCSRFWETLIPTSTTTPTSPQIQVLQGIMKAASATAREALQRYVRRIAYTWDMDDSVSDPIEGYPSMGWYNIEVQDNNEVLITINSGHGDHLTFNTEFAAKWAPVMAIFTEKYVSEGKLRAFEQAVSGYVGKKVEAEINWQPCIRSHAFKALGASRVETSLRGLHTVQLDYLKQIWKSTSEWTESGKRIVGERIDRIVITMEAQPAAWSLQLQDRTLYITMGYDQAPRQRPHLQEDIEWITEATIPIEIEAANRNCAKLTKDLSAQAKKDINISIKWEAFVSIPDFVARGHDTVVTIMRNVYDVASHATSGIKTALTHEIGFKAITDAIKAVEVVLEPNNVADEPILSLKDGVVGVSVGYASTAKRGKILARRERIENLLDVIVEVHKALADARYKAVVDGLAASLDGRVVPVDVDWSIVDTPQFKDYLPENKSLVVENLRAGFPEAVVTKGLVLTNKHPVGKAFYSAGLKSVFFRVIPNGVNIDKVENKDGQLYIELDLPRIVGSTSGNWQVRAEEAFGALVPVAQYDSLEAHKAGIANKIAQTLGKPLELQPNWDFTSLPEFQSKSSAWKRTYVLRYLNDILESIFFNPNGLPALCDLSLVHEYLVDHVDSLAIKVNPSLLESSDHTFEGQPSLEGKQLVLTVSLIDQLPRTASWGYKLDKALGLRKVIIEHFITRYGKEQIDQVRADLATGIGAPIGFEFDTSQVIASEQVAKIDKFNELVTYLKTLYDLPGQNISGKAGVVWLCNHNPTARAKFLECVKTVRLIIDPTDSTPAFEGHPYQSDMYQVRIADGVLNIQMNQNRLMKAHIETGEVVEWTLTPNIAREKEKIRIEEEREAQKRWAKEQRRRDKEREKERRHRELMSKLKH